MRRDSPFNALPALFAAVMLAGSSAGATPVMVALCAGGSAEQPGGTPAGDCDTACHFGCTRRKAKG